jgi:glyoxylase-like metal-dependent hydrolase (beta-lactamase superfamily II)
MKILIIITLFFTSLLPADTFDYKLTPKKISENVWCFFGALEPPSKENGGAMVNSCYVKTKDSFVVIDSGPSYQFATQSYIAMSKIAKLPVKVVIASHEHDDHWLGNNYYKEKFSSKLIGSESIDLNHNVGDQTRMFQTLSKSAIKGTKIVKLDQHIKEPTIITVGGEVFEIIPIGEKAHSSEDLFIYMPKKKVLFAGDVVMNGRITSNRDGSIIGQLKAHKLIKSKDWNILIAGHGFITDKTAMDESSQYFTLLKQRVSKALEDDIEADKITKIVKMKEFEDKAMYKELNARNVLDAFIELELVDEE